MASNDAVTVENLAAQFPLTFPVPSPTTHSELLTPGDLNREEDLLRNPQSFRHWWTAINNVKDNYRALQRSGQEKLDVSPEVAALLGPLASPLSRITLQRLTYLYEGALRYFPGSFKLWRSYLATRMNFVLGKLETKKRAGGRKKLPEMKDALEEEREELEKWTGGLDGIVGWEEWKSLIATFERALMWLPKARPRSRSSYFPRLWLMYLSIFFHPFCPPQISHTHARRTYDRALRTLPPSLHHRIWVRYLLWAERQGGITTVAIFRRYLAVDPSVTEYYTALLLAENNPTPRPLEAAKLLLSLARKAAKGQYTSPEGKSPYQLLTEWLEVVEKYAEEVGLDVEDTDAAGKQAAQVEEAKKEVDQATSEPASVHGQLIRIAGPPVTVNADGTAVRPYDEDEDPTSSRKLNIERIIHEDGLAVYKDQAGRLWTGLATYWIKRAEFDRAKATFEAGLASVLTIRDFTQIFDAYAEFSESLISAMMESIAEPDEDEDEESAQETEKELDEKMREFEQLMDRRPFLLNDVLLRRNPNDVQEWEKRLALWGEDDDKVAETYKKAIETINPRKATPNLYRIYVNFAKFYEEGGVSGKAESDIISARKVLEKATKVPFKTVEDLAEVWCEWAEMELRHDNYDEAIRVMQRAAAVPKNTKINYHDQTLPVQARLFKSLKLWSYYVDLEEAIGTVSTAKAVYEKILELRIANAQIIVNYAAFLEENKYFEESFKVYEKGVELFTYPISFEIWNIYLSKFVKRYGGSKLERARDLFEQALDKCPPKFCKPIFLMYAQLEEEYGLAKRAMAVYDRATGVVQDDDKFEMFTIYIAKAASNYGLPATRPIYERAIEVLPARQTAQMCLRFAALERKLGEIDRARAIYAHASQFCDPRTNPGFWAEWNAFEIDTGSEDTFREMLRIKRSVQAQFNTEASYLAAQTVAARDGASAKQLEEESAALADPMAQAEKAAVAGGAPSFVAAKQSTGTKETGEATPAASSAPAGNAEEIHISDDEDL
ncbi:spliceosome complex protein [Punctularia strigosozonata HHB-11173 SS5]|uniref:spliceosome complex protein n=1 Tax=Punctularia strigosozonata (strain HHB-11173) TaxID=741275 RepID=UPI00044173EC|nr:spliceosome complex protein [Punctularia strigosozonata HHB-11173 SS5]EIN07716.1 spliceosome complex protein [Punctularia strigosozonata HHB-11173 SS5]